MGCDIRLGHNAHGLGVDDAPAAGRARQQLRKGLIEGIGAGKGDAAAGATGLGPYQRYVRLDRQVDQGVGIGLFGNVEPPTRLGRLSPGGEGEQAQSTEGRAQSGRSPGYGASSPSRLRRLIALKQNIPR